MSDDEDTHSVSEGEELDGESEQHDREIPHKKSSDSFDFGDSMDDYEEEENDDDEDEDDDEDDENDEQQDQNGQGVAPEFNDDNSVKSLEPSVDFTEATDDKSKFQQMCIDTMSLLRTATSKSITPQTAKKALDMVYKNCKARFHAKEQLGSSGAAEYLFFLFKRWRSDSELLLRCAEVISEFVVNETENKILVGIQKIGRHIVLALEEHRRHWPAIYALSNLTVDLCNAKLPGMLQKNAKTLPPRKMDVDLAYDVSDTIKNAISRDEVADQIFQKTEIIDPEQESKLDPMMNNTHPDLLPGDVSVLGTSSVLDEDQWLLDNREQFGNAGMCHMLTHIVSLICDYHNAHSQTVGHTLLLRRPTTTTTSSGASTPRHHLHRSALAAGRDPTLISMSPRNSGSLTPAGTTPLVMSSSSTSSLPILVPDSSNTSSNNVVPLLGEGGRDSPIRPSSGKSGKSGKIHAMAGAGPENSHLRLQLPAIATSHVHTPQDGSSSSATANASPSKASTPKQHGNTTGSSPSNQQHKQSHSSSHHHHHHHSNPNTNLQQLLYTNHDFSSDDLIASLMRAVAVLSDFEPNAKRFGIEGMCLYITHLLKDKSATSAAAIGSARSSSTTNIHSGSDGGDLISTSSSTSAGAAAVLTMAGNSNNNSNPPRLPAQFMRTNSLLWAMILLCADTSTGNRELFGEAGATFLLLDRLHEIMRNVEVYRKDIESRRYVEYLSWALLNLVLDCPMNCLLVKKVTYADVVLDHLITLEVEVMVPDPKSLSRSNTSSTTQQTSKSQAKEILMRANQNSILSDMGRKSLLGGSRNASRRGRNASQGNQNIPMIPKKEFAMSSGTRYKLGKVKELVYCVM